MIHDLWMLNRIKVFPVARRNYCHKIKPQVYVHVFTSISVLQNSLSNTTSLTALEILQLLLQLLFNRMIFTETKILVHFYKKKSWTSSSFSMTFHDLGCFPWLSRPGNGLNKFHDFPGKVVTLSASSRLIPNLSRLFSAVLLQFVLGWHGHLLNPRTFQCHDCCGMRWWSINITWSSQWILLSLSTFSVLCCPVLNLTSSSVTLSFQTKCLPSAVTSIQQLYEIQMTLCHT